MAYIVSITYDTAAPSRDVGSYALSMDITDEAPTGRLAETGPVWNGKRTLCGVFPRFRDAVDAICGYVDAPFTIVERRGLADDGFSEPPQTTFRLDHVDFRDCRELDTMHRVVATKSPTGLLIALNGLS